MRIVFRVEYFRKKQYLFSSCHIVMEIEQI